MLDITRRRFLGWLGLAPIAATAALSAAHTVAPVVQATSVGMPVDLDVEEQQTRVDTFLPMSSYVVHPQLYPYR